MAANGMGFSLDRQGVGEILRSAEIQDVCLEAAHDVAGVARSIAPVDTGEYRDKIGVEPAEDHDRKGADVIADVDHGAAVDLGNAHTHGLGHHVLTRSAEIAGLDVS